MKKFIFAALLFAGITAFAQPRPAAPVVPPTWADIDYVGDGLVGHKLDIYLPENATEKNKVIVIIYGSAWFSNNSKVDAYNTMGKVLNDNGFAVVSINHRSSPEAEYPAQIHDVKAAVRFIRANADKYKLDPSFIGITGYSSGGHLSSLCAATNGVKFAKSGEVEINVEGNLGAYTDYSSYVDACVDWFGPLDISKMDEKCQGYKDDKSPEATLLRGNPADKADMGRLLDPGYYLDAQDPNYLVIHGDADNVVPYCQSVLFAEKLMELDKLEEFITVPGGGHGPITMNEDTFAKMVNFFKAEANR